jgi:hypothetical protein
MNLLKRFFGTPDRNLTNQARKLLPAAQVLAASSYTTAATKFPTIWEIDKKHWDFVLAIGGVFVGISQLNHETISEPTRDSILDILVEAVRAWETDGPKAIEDCRQFVDRTYDGVESLPEYRRDPQFLFSDSLGGWVVWNLFGHAPSTHEENQFVRVLGGMLVNSFMYWWR